ncbi:MAG: NAD(P)/FAD-dependent oxidoreductase [Desulfobacterales bacterium]|jgi:flavin-dependent dehydrogenase|nr:NAD(P)/FAD-dependent oxidoreductase [Desulfobacterales bacterium]
MVTYDVIIVGACTAGTFFSSLLAQKGLKVLVVDKDKEENLSKRLDIFHFTRQSFKDYGLEESKEGDEEFVRNFNLCYSKSALDNYLKKSFLEVAVMHLPLFIRRLRKAAINHGVTFRFETSFDHLIYDENKQINGIATTNGEEILARLVVDASGIPSVIRRTINDPYIESFEIGPRDKFYVLLKYVELLNPVDKVEYSTSWPYFKGWIAPQHKQNGAIVGVGANLSSDYARKCMAKFEENIKLPKYKLQYEEMGCTPYRRPPFSFVTDRFLVIGDAACLTKPMNGEGITSAWAQCAPAAEIVAGALKNAEYPTKESLWKINTLYQRGEGAEYANLRATLIGAVDMSMKDNDYMFKESVVFKSDDKEVKGSVTGKLLKGVFTGQFSFKALLSLLNASSLGKKLENHYKNYPANPSGYFAWKNKAEKLWKKAGTMADTITDA